jgi:hypothetical protein
MLVESLPAVLALIACPVFLKKTRRRGLVLGAHAYYAGGGFYRPGLCHPGQGGKLFNGAFDMGTGFLLLGFAIPLRPRGSWRRFPVSPNCGKNSRRMIRKTWRFKIKIWD